MHGAWRWLRRIAIGAYAIIAGFIGGGGRVIVDRREMYGDDATNDPYSIEFDPDRQRR
jgi:hypothetical protein